MVKRMRSYLSAILLMMIAVTVNAQVTTATLGGKVTDTDNEAIIGATIQAIHEPSGTMYGAITNVDGRYTIQGMRAGGPYKVEISYVGYETATFTGVTLHLGETTNISTHIKESSELLGEVVVVGKAGIDATKTGAAMSINADDINRMPSITNSIADITRLNPQISVSTSGAMSFAGTNNRYNTFMVDGAANNDVFGLTANGSNGGQAGAQPISMETVEQIQVSVAPFDVRQSGFTGGAINAITKSGTNEFHGSVYGDWLNQSLIGSRYTKMDGTTSKAYGDEKEYRYGLTVGGPIVKNKLFFFANYEKSNKEYPNNFGLGSDLSKVNKDEALKVIEKLNQMAAEQGVDYNTSLSNPNNYTKSDKVGVKLDWNISDNHKASVRWSLVSAKQLNSNSSAANLRASNNQYDFVSKTHTFIAELQSRFSDNISNEARFSYVRVRDNRQPYGAPVPQLQISNVGDGTLFFGTEYSSGANSLDQDIYTFTDNLTWYVGNHTLTFGTNNEFYTFQNLFIQNIYGSYSFDNVDDFLNGKIKVYQYGHANEAVTGDFRWAPKFSSAQVGFYIQDKFEVNDNLQLTYGLRADMPIAFDTPTANVPFNDYAASKGWDVRTDHKLSSTPYWSPRLGFRWNIQGDNKYVLRGGAGIFTGRIPFVWLSNNFSNTGIQMTSYYVSRPEIEVLLDPNKQHLHEDKLKASGAQTINVFEEDFRFTQNARFNLAFDFELAGINWTAEGIYSKTLNDVVYSDISRDVNGKTLGEVYPNMAYDNRPMFDKVTTGTDFSNIYMLSNTSKGYSYNLSIMGTKKFDFGLDVMASYAYSVSKSVNSGTSSVAKSNFRYNYTRQNANNPELGNSAFNRPHQIKASAFYHEDFFKNQTTTFGLIYTGTSGSPYSIYYYGDVNGDGADGNDLMFIPTDAQIDQMAFVEYKNSKTGKVIYTIEDQRQNMKQWIAGDSYLSKHRGEYYERYADNEDFEHHFDFHFSHEVKFKVGRQYNSVELTFDILNVGNLLNKDWGHYGANGGASVYYSPLTYKGNGEFQFLHDGDYQMRSYSDYYSRWRGQIGLKYTF